MLCRRQNTLWMMQRRHQDHPSAECVITGRQSILGKCRIRASSAGPSFAPDPFVSMREESALRYARAGMSGRNLERSVCFVHPLGSRTLESTVRVEHE